MVDRHLLRGVTSRVRGNSSSTDLTRFLPKVGQSGQISPGRRGRLMEDEGPNQIWKVIRYKAGRF